MNNIAEGFEKRRKDEQNNFLNKDFIKYLFIAKSSSGEIRSMLFALDLKYISKEDFKKINSRINEISGLITGFINFLK